MNGFRLLYLISLFFLFAFSSLQAQSILIYTQVSNPTARHIGFAYKKSNTDENASFFRIDLKSDNSSQFELSLDTAKFVELHYNNEVVPLYLETGDNLQIYFDGSDMHHSIRFEGQGARNNNFLAQYRQQFRSSSQKTYDIGYLTVDIDETFAHKAANSTASAYSVYCQNSQEQQTRFLNQHKNQISSFLYAYLQTEIQYSNATHRVIWFLEHQYESVQRSKNAIPIYAKTTDDAILHHPAYTNFLKANLFYQYLPEDLNRYKVYYPLYEVANQNFSGQSKAYLLSELLTQVYNRSGSLDFAYKYFGDFASQNPYPIYTEKVLSMYGGQLSGTPDVAAPNFDMIDTNRNLVALSDYEGKVVYLSFWASWCKPCIEGFKKSASIREQLQDMGVILLNVSIDKKETAWREAMIRHQPIGVNGLVLSLEDIYKKYNISSIPLYEIIDKNGKFAYLSDNAQRNILDEFRRLVER